MKENNFTGEYKMTIKNFYPEEGVVYIIVENSTKNWVVDVTVDNYNPLSDDIVLDNVIRVHKYIKIGDDIDEYTINQYKKSLLYQKTLQFSKRYKSELGQYRLDPKSILIVKPRM